VHTSGTTKGVQKPIPLSDAALNEAVARILKMEEFRPMEGRAVIWLLLHPASSYTTVDMIHLPLAYGGCVVSSPRVFSNPKALRTIEHYKVNVFFMPVGFPELIMKLPFRPDLSSLELVVLGGGFVSPENKRKYDKFLIESGSDAKLMIGYGLAEVGAACFLAPPDNEIASFGYPMPGVKVKLYSEEDERFYNIDDGQHTGVMYISSGSLSSGKIGREVFFRLEKIDGEDYLNTNDVVRVNEVGSLTFVGRANRFFVNNEGVRFDAGLVETAVASQPGIVDCGLVPAYSKAIHDTVPVLYLETEDNEGSGQKTAREALVNVFIRESGIKKSNLPSQCMICGELPRNSSGKVDIFRIREEGAKGKRYKVEPVYRDGSLADVKLRRINEADMSDVKGVFASYGIPEELDNYHNGKLN
jgi:acyl-coenzyme A synthetase/AMP-(fatty) acid ligase